MNKTLTMDDLVKELPIKPQQIRNYLKSGRLKGIRTRYKWFVKTKDLQEFKQTFGF